MRTQEYYDSVFAESVPIEVWPILVNVFKSVDAALINSPSLPKKGEKVVRGRRPVVALISVARRIGTFGYKIDELVELKDKGEVTAIEVEEILAVFASTQANYDWRRKVKQPLVLECCAEAAKSFGIAGVDMVGRRGIHPPATFLEQVALTPDFVEKVNELLPPQPWKQGVHIDIAAELKCRNIEVKAAIQRLIATGKRLPQRGGVVSDAEGNELAIDPERMQNN